MSMTNVYRKIAKKHGVTVAEARREAQAALDHAYQSANAGSVTTAYQQQVPRKGEVPTAEEFIRYAAEKATR